VRDDELLFAPGTNWAYSNTDYVLAGLMIERATGLDLREELDRRIIRPLRLQHTSFPTRNLSPGRDASRGYSLDLGPAGPMAASLRDATRYSPSFAWGSGNGVSTVGDVARFSRGLLGGRLLAPALLREMLAAVPTGRPGRRYGLGLNVFTTSKGVLVGHDGQVPGYDVRARSSRDERRQAVVAANVKFAPPGVEDALEAALEVAVASRR
jgi:D-alanyl-D-alanine carboxypeptidase